MEYWFVITLCVIAVLAIALLLFIELLGDDAILSRKKKAAMNKFVNVETNLIGQTIRDTVNSEKAYHLFVDYICINNKHFLTFVKTTLREMNRAHDTHDMPVLHACMDDIGQMKLELKRQKLDALECKQTIDNATYIEAVAWIHLGSNCRFNINEGLKHLAQSCIYYMEHYDFPFPGKYEELLGYLVEDTCHICDSCIDIFGTTDIAAMRELRKRISVVLDESYTNTRRLYEILHDGRSQIEPDTRIALQYALNAFQELHCMIYTMRRFVLSNIGITLSIMTIDADKENPYPTSPLRND